MRRSLVCLALGILGGASWYALPGQAQPPKGEDVTPAAGDEERERKIIERFVGILEKNPRRGTALDRVYGHHVERGSLEQLLQQYRDRATKSAKDGLAWMVVGLIEAQR